MVPMKLSFSFSVSVCFSLSVAHSFIGFILLFFKSHLIFFVQNRIVEWHFNKLFATSCDAVAVLHSRVFNSTKVLYGDQIYLQASSLIMEFINWIFLCFILCYTVSGRISSTAKIRCVIHWRDLSSAWSGSKQSQRQTRIINDIIDSAMARYSKIERWVSNKSDDLVLIHSQIEHKKQQHNVNYSDIIRNVCSVSQNDYRKSIDICDLSWNGCWFIIDWLEINSQQI